MFKRLRSDPFGRALGRGLPALVIVTAGGFIASALGAEGIDASTTAGALVGGLASIAAALAFRNAQLTAAAKRPPA